MKILVVYYSLSGNTKQVAIDLANAFKADIEEITDQKKRNGFFRYMFNGKDGMQKKATDINPVKYNPAEYDLVIVGTPVWVNMTPAVRTYLNQYKGQLKQVAFFCTMGGSAVDKVFSEMELVSKAKPIKTLAITSEEVKQQLYQNKLRQFVGKIQNHPLS